MAKKPSQNWGMEENIQFPEKIYASDDDLSSDGKLILCSRYQKNTDDMEYISTNWISQQLNAALSKYPEILDMIKQSLII